MNMQERKAWLAEKQALQSEGGSPLRRHTTDVSGGACFNLSTPICRACRTFSTWLYACKLLILHHVPLHDCSASPCAHRWVCGFILDQSVAQHVCLNAPAFKLCTSHEFPLDDCQFHARITGSVGGGGEWAVAQLQQQLAAAKNQLRKSEEERARLAEALGEHGPTGTFNY